MPFISLIVSINYHLAYGKCGEDISRHSSTQVVYDDQELRKLDRKALFKGFKEYTDESGDIAGYEVQMLKSTNNDSKPVHIAICILQWSKILFLK